MALLTAIAGTDQATPLARVRRCIRGLVSVDMDVIIFDPSDI
jgi:hypothetical protein